MPKEVLKIGKFGLREGSPIKVRVSAKNGDGWNEEKQAMNVVKLDTCA